MKVYFLQSAKNKSNVLMRRDYGIYKKKILFLFLNRLLLFD